MKRSRSGSNFLNLANLTKIDLGKTEIAYLLINVIHAVSFGSAVHVLCETITLGSVGLVSINDIIMCTSIFQYFLHFVPHWHTNRVSPPPSL